MSEDRSRLNARLSILATLVVTGVLAVAAIALIIVNRVGDTSSSATSTGGHPSSNTSASQTLVSGNVPLSEVENGAGPITSIAVDLVSRAFSFTPSGFDAQVAAAKRLMTGAMAMRYDGLIKSERVKQLVQMGLTVNTSLLHVGNDPKQPAFVGVSSVTPTTAQFLMDMQRLVTTSGSKQAQASTVVLSVTIQKIGGTWVISSID